MQLPSLPGSKSSLSNQRNLALPGGIVAATLVAIAPQPAPAASLRFASFNASLNRDAQGQLISDLHPLLIMPRPKPSPRSFNGSIQTLC
nr:hypothetical protein [Halomicronema hongdechloris]